MLNLERRRSYFYENLLESVDPEWDRVSAAKGLLNPPAALSAAPSAHEGADRLLVGFVLVRRLLLSAKCLVLAAMRP
jgi:hypothetical protein